MKEARQNKMDIAGDEHRETFEEEGARIPRKNIEKNPGNELGNGSQRSSGDSGQQEGCGRSVCLRQIITKEDYRSFVSFCLVGKGRYSKKLYFGGLVVSLVLLIAQHPMIPDILVYVAFAYLLAFIFFYVYFRKKTVKYIKENPVALDYPLELSFSSSGMEEIDEHKRSSRTMSWNDFCELYETQDYFYLLPDAMGTYILSKKRMEEDAAHVLGSLMQEHAARRFRRAK